MKRPQVRCPRCGATYFVEAAPPKGIRFRCGKCNTAFVPLVAGEPPAPAPAPVEPDLVGQVIGGCRVLERRRQGGLGTVYKAHHLALDVPVALRVLPAHLTAERAAFVARFYREARAAARIQHPAIAGALNVGEERGLHFVVTPYIDGESLQERLAAKGRLDAREAVAVARQVCAALAVARAQGIAHRDLNPAHIFIDRQGLVKVADFGLVREVEEAPEGTPAGASAADFSGDLYALGGVLFQMVAGRAAPATPVDPRAADPQMPPALAAVIRRLTAPDPAERYQTPEEVLAELDRPEMTAPARAPSRWPGFLRRWLRLRG